MSRFETDDLWQCEVNANAGSRAAYAAHGRQPPGPPKPPKPNEEAEWAARPDRLAPFWCRCGLIFHVRRHLEAHTTTCTEARA